jgi:hypothetical protein
MARSINWGKNQWVNCQVTSKVNRYGECILKDQSSFKKWFIPNNNETSHNA